MNIITFLQTHTIPLLIISGILGACIGSFLNVVIYRLPIMLFKNWQQECQILLKTGNRNTQTEKFNLSAPRSHCYKCKHTILVRHNIPLLSYLLLAGKCAYCKHHISAQYFFIELSCTLLSIFICAYYGISWKLLGALLLTWSLLPLIVIDFKEKLLPDEITLPLLWLGLIFNSFNLFTPLTNAIFGAIIGYLSLWLITYIYKLFTKKIAMGNGDFKLLAVFGAWLGWQALPFIIFFAALSGSIFGFIWLCYKRKKMDTTIAFGPYLAIAGWLALILHNNLAYWSYLLINR